MIHDAIYQPILQNSEHAIVKAVCEKFGVTVDELRGRARPWRIVWPRWVIMLLFADCNWTPEQIGELLGKDRTTILYGTREAKNLIKNNYKAAAQVGELLEQLKDSQLIPKRRQS